MMDVSRLTPVQRLYLAIAALDTLNGKPRRATRWHYLPRGCDPDTVLQALSATYRPGRSTRPRTKRSRSTRGQTIKSVSTPPGRVSV